MKIKRILVAMSGGIDSSVAAFLLKQQGHEVIGATMLLHEENQTFQNTLNDAQSVAQKIGIKHLLIDFRTQFVEITENFTNEYLAGRTPNPCVLCNYEIKFGLLLQKALQMDCQALATGHYAQIEQHNNRFFVKTATDTSKDQSYFLWRLQQNQLSKIIFPVGNLLKSDVKKIGTQNNLEKISQKKESYDICFANGQKLETYLSNELKKKNIQIQKGQIFSTTGQYLGTHHGLMFYTIGQNKGLEISANEPLYVVNKIPQTNTLLMGEKQETQKKGIKLHTINLQKYTSLPENKELFVQLRYRNQLHPCTIKQIENEIFVVFRNEVTEANAGQSAVFYENNDILGGGIIA